MREGVLVIDETGDVKDGTHTAHVPDGSIWAAWAKLIAGSCRSVACGRIEHVYYPLEVIPYTPAAWFAQGRTDP